MTDARFEDAAGAPLNLGAMDPDDLQVLSALLQDAVLTVADVAWQKRHQRLTLLVNRLRREDGVHVSPPERVRALLAVENVIGVLARPMLRTRARMSKAADKYARFRVKGRACQTLGQVEAPAWCFVNMPMSDVSSTEIRARGEWHKKD